MRYLKLIFISLMVILTFGCQSNNDRRISINEYKTLSIVDMVDDYSFTSQNLLIYTSSSDSGSYYVDIESFLSVLSEGLSDISIEKTDVMTLSVQSKNDPSLPIYTLTIDSKSNTLVFNDFKFIDALDSLQFDYMGSYAKSVSHSIQENTSEKVINLNDYQFNIVLKDDHYYLPLFLANLFFTSNAFDVYHYNDNLYIFSDYKKISRNVMNVDLSMLDEDQLVRHSIHYLELLFDHFYGLGDGSEVMDLYHMDEVHDLPSFLDFFQHMVFGLNDLHTEMVEPGYTLDNFSRIGAPADSRYAQMLIDFFDNDGNVRSGEAMLYVTNEYYILEINRFSPNTGHLVEEFLSNIDESKPIVIDLTTNLGGHMSGVIDLLTFMTDEPFTLKSTYNGTSAIESISYQTTESHALKNPFYIMTSTVTFGAANVFTSIVRDMELGVVAGSTTAGGSAEVNYAILPSNIVMTYPSQRTFYSETNQPIEDGINPMVPINQSQSIYDRVDEVLHFFRNNTTYTLTDNSSFTGVDFNLLIESVDDVFENQYFEVQIRDLLSGVLIDQSIPYTDSFQFEYPLSQETMNIRVVLISHYRYNNIDYSEELYSIYYDDYPDAIPNEDASIHIGEYYEGYKHASSDADYIRLILDTPTAFQFYVNDEFQKVIVFDHDGRELLESVSFGLDQGEYYFLILFNSGYIGNYTFHLEEVYDDSILPKHVDLVPGMQELTMQLDYFLDRDEFSFTLDQESYFTLYLDNPTTWLDVTFVNLGFNSMIPYGFKVYHDETVLLPSGDYVIGINQAFIVDEYPNTASFHLNIDPLEGDISGNLSLTDDDYGVLYEGTFSLHYNGPLDHDIYAYQASKNGYVQFVFNNAISPCLISNSGLVCETDWNIFPVETGMNYFLFVGHYFENDYQTTFFFDVINDESDEENPLEIALGDHLSVSFEFTNDNDYYIFTLNDFTLIDIHMPDLAANYQIMDASGHVYIDSTEKENTFQLPPGEFVMMLTYAFDDGIPKVTQLEFELSSIDDEFPNYSGFDLSLYQIYNLDSEQNAYRQSDLDYSGDVDIFYVNVLETNTYLFACWSIIDGVVYVIVDENNNRQPFLSGQQYELGVGLYSIEIYHPENKISHYSVNIMMPLVIG